MTYLTAYIALRLFLSGKTATSNQLKEKHFKPKAHILTLLGEELIKNANQE